MERKIIVGGADLTIEQLEEFILYPHMVELAPEAIQKIEHCREYLDRKVATSDRPLYGITTGFGSLCNRSISSEDLTTLQENLIKSHACSTGKEVKKEIVRLMMLLKAHALSLGHSGVQLCTVEWIVEMLNKDITPVVFDRGSLGASGDLAPLANLFLPMIGYGEVFYKGARVPAKEALAEAGIALVTLKSKEGLALLNGTQFMSSHGVYALIQAKKILTMATSIAALSLEGFNGLDAPFTEELHTIRNHKGQVEIARHMRKILEGSTHIREPKPYVQDPYSFRCIPQVHGASYDAIAHVRRVVEEEINGVTDNPTIFPDQDMILSGGNFHGQPLAIVYDFLALALAELGNISERRVAQLIFGLRDLPEFLVAKPGLNSGFMIPQYAAASMVSQNKMYCFNAASDSIVSSNNQEDHVSMGANAATKLLPLIDNLYRIFGIELMNAAQAFEFRRPATTSPVLEALLKEFRTVVPRVEDDVVMYQQIEDAYRFVQTYPFIAM